ncbi:MAG: GntR family transcriptional regulator, partial [Alphaproteobacteria bacterium]|nr:GntR family transcriptional regulator [Alphaproteobacteria bacterium]MDX5368528.1 GntR family transcriptional regulator [Alphaproteobacteria bacterium]
TRMTVRHALQELVYENLIVRQKGRGSFVSEMGARVTSPIDTRECHSFEEQVAVTGAVVTFRPLSFGLVEADKEVASTLRIAAGEDVFRLLRLRLIGDRPVCLEIRHIPTELAARVTGEMLARRSVHDFLSEIVGHRVPTIAVTVVAEKADAETARLLKVEEGDAMIVRENTYLDAAGRPIQCGRSVFPGDIRLEYVLGKHATPISGD